MCAFAFTFTARMDMSLLLTLEKKAFITWPNAVFIDSYGDRSGQIWQLRYTNDVAVRRQFTKEDNFSRFFSFPAARRYGFKVCLNYFCFP